MELLNKKVVICEVGPRDGFQAEKEVYDVETKVELIKKVVEAGVKVIEVGSFVHPKAVPQLADTDEVVKQLPKIEGVEYRALVTNKKGVERALAAGAQKIKLTVSASRTHNMNNFNRTPEETVEGFRECVELARERDVKVSGAISTSFGCPFEGDIPSSQIEMIVNAFQEMGVNEISLSDTTGVANPMKVYSLCTEMKSKFPNINWVLHFHNTRGMALANIYAGLQAGVTYFDGAFAGLGGCPYAPGASGNVATEDVVHMLEEMGIETGIDLDKIITVGKNVREIVGRQTDSFILKAGKCSDLIPKCGEGQQKF